MRVDSWLWAARFFKTRSLATEAVKGGRVEINGESVKPAKEVRVGDVVRISRGRVVFVVTVTGLSDRRGPARLARELYEESEASRAERERQAELLRAAPPLGSDLSGRPTKRDRRRLERVRSSTRKR